jgi:hypothetical protein
VSIDRAADVYGVAIVDDADPARRTLDVDRTAALRE